MPSPQKNQQLDSKTVAYEFKMLCCTALRLPSVDQKADWVLHNALVQSFALHCRNMLAFFFGHDRASGFIVRASDVVATDFCSTWSERWDATLFGRAKEQADKHVAHISTERQDMNSHGGPASTWDIPALVPRFFKLMERFLSQAAGTLDPSAEKVLQDALAELRPYCPPLSHATTGHPAPSPVTHVNTIPPPWMAAKSAPPDK
jgi:hypothetical protein